MTEARDTAGDRWLFAIPAGLALILIVLGTMFIALERHGAELDRRMRSWPSTTGTVTGAELQDRPNQDGRMSQYASTGYRYEVAGRTYEFTISEYVGIGIGHKLPHQENESVRVYYDPADPSHGSLTNDPGPPHMLMLSIAVALIALSLPFLYLSARMFRKRPRASAGAAP
jgi:hypothetical protein